MTHALKNPTAAAMVVALYAAIPADGAEWSSIVVALRAQFAVKNWLTQVRGPLQALANAGVVARTKDVHKEVWYRIPTDGALTAAEILRVCSR